MRRRTQHWAMVVWAVLQRASSSDAERVVQHSCCQQHTRMHRHKKWQSLGLDGNFVTALLGLWHSLLVYFEAVPSPSALYKGEQAPRLQLRYVQARDPERPTGSFAFCF